MTYWTFKIVRTHAKYETSEFSQILTGSSKGRNRNVPKPVSDTLICLLAGQVNNSNGSFVHAFPWSTDAERNPMDLLFICVTDTWLTTDRP